MTAGNRASRVIKAARSFYCTSEGTLLFDEPDAEIEDNAPHVRLEFTPPLS